MFVVQPSHFVQANIVGHVDEQSKLYAINNVCNYFCFLSLHHRKRGQIQQKQLILLTQIKVLGWHQTPPLIHPPHPHHPTLHHHQTASQIVVKKAFQSIKRKGRLYRTKVVNNMEFIITFCALYRTVSGIFHYIISRIYTLDEFGLQIYDLTKNVSYNKCSWSIHNITSRVLLCIFILLCM